MSRIPAHGAIVGTTTVSAVLALCLLGGVGATAPAAADEATTVPSTTSTSLITAENTANEVGIATPNTASEGLATTALVLSGVMTNAVMTANSATAVDTAATESGGTAASIATMQTLGLAGGVASEQVPAQAMLSRNAAAATATALAAPAAVAKKVAAPKAAAAAITGTPITGTPLQIAHTIATQAGLSQQQWGCLDSLWYQESKFEANARNYRSGAFGIPQALPASRMASAGADWRTNPATQVKWGLSYIKIRYGTACNAWAHWKRDRWY
ncbi:MAG TPA: transglycosylase SLT domain-containing protein [Acidothermaceae bacterium]|nr:transglycosylase SLT domain-containing protein [Acidothermaceae bacterium]